MVEAKGTKQAARTGTGIEVLVSSKPQASGIGNRYKLCASREVAEAANRREGQFEQQGRNPHILSWLAPDKLGTADTQTNMLPGIPRQRNVRSKF